MKGLTIMMVLNMLEKILWKMDNRDNLKARNLGLYYLLNFISIEKFD